MGIRLFDNCNDKSVAFCFFIITADRDYSGCSIKEWPNTIRLAGSRWYPGVVRITDGSVLVMGGMTEGGFNNARATDKSV